ncbi:hypothetical protein [Pseudomonas trivialis]|uniref:hypothetical protein n=1 Tax=Pseudomonas trivialis TaxID=200450 RepID=UPI0030D024FD
MRIDHAGHGNHAGCLDNHSVAGLDVFTYGRDGAVFDKDIAARQIADITVHAQHSGAADKGAGGRSGRGLHNAAVIFSHFLYTSSNFVGSNVRNAILREKDG